MVACCTPDTGRLVGDVSDGWGRDVSPSIISIKFSSIS